MSELVIEHPIPLIENLLKAGKGDEGRLLYLRKALKNGKVIYESDKNYLYSMQKEYSEILFTENTSEKQSQNISVPKKLSKEIKNKSTKTQRKTSQTKETFDSFEFELETIKGSLQDLKTKESKIKDNLEFLSMNREILTQTTIDRSNSFGSFSNLPKTTPSDLFELIKNTPTMEKTKIGIKKHDVMAYVSAGLFSLWFVGYSNLIDLGVFQGLSLGFSAGAAVSAGLFYRKLKSEKN
ncbi:MAG: hypothetical protein ACE5Q4_03390 [Nitrosopumilus sp.]|uniref:Uncharacterized protein n=2 Tax=Candidatus Nitrosomaritimum aestuariumsis TaxID=3342354 RepID=A0AC60W7P5_9ARCH|nr:hypothetical protein [Nitrosopumilaceae archaeon]MBA4463382.1 hypothetical protein [Nitrosopumilaceae archaeon]